MKLLHPEVDIIPGRPGQRPQVTPVREEQPLPGSAVLRLTNTTSQENAYTVRLRSDHAFWQDSWYTVIALPPGQGAENAPPPGKPDQRGPQDRWVKLYVPRSGSRDVLLRFNVPARPESRAGKYPYKIEIETQITGPSDGTRRKDRMTELPAVAIVRPFYKWSVDLSPEEKRVGRRHRAAEFEIVVNNEGNDWLYCDLLLPRPKDLMIEAPTMRLAVPPPEPGEMITPAPGAGDQRPGTQRSVPLKAVSRLKVFRGEIARQPLPVTAQRVDAPTVPPAAGDGYAGMGAVVASPTTENQQLTGERSLLYCPPIPAKLTDFFSKSAGSVQQWIVPLLGLIVMVHLGFFAFENWFQQVKVQTVGPALPSKMLVITGKAIVGSKIVVTGKKGNGEDQTYDLGVATPILTNALDNMSVDTNRAQVKIPPELDGVTGKLTARRFNNFFWYMPGLPSDTKPIQIGNPIVVVTPEVVQLAQGSYQPGQKFTVGVTGFTQPGTILLNGGAVNAQWNGDKVIVTMPPGSPGQQFVVKIKAHDSDNEKDAGVVTVAAPLVASTGGGTGGEPGGGGAGGGGGAAGGPGGGGGGSAAGGGGGGSGGAGGSGGQAGGGQAGGNTPVKPQPHKVVVHPKPSPKKPKVHLVSQTKPSGSPYELTLQGNYAGAAAAAGSILAGKPNDASTLALKAYDLAQSGNAAAAAPLATKALQLTSGQSEGRARALALVAQGAVAEAGGNTTLARQSYQLAGGADPTLALTYIAFADDFHKSGKDDMAKSMLQGALSSVTNPQETQALQAKISSLSQ